MSSSGKRFATPVLLSAALHAVIALIAGWIIISRQRPESPLREPPIASTSPARGASEKPPGASPGTSAHSALLHRQAVQIRTLASASWQAPSLPKAPPPREKTQEGLKDFLQSVEISSFGGISKGLGTGLGVAALPTAALPAPQFLGTPITGEKILLLFDVSRTVANAAAQSGMNMEKIRAETGRLIDQLGVHTRFGLLQFARNYALFRPDLAVTTEANRREARHWLERHFGTDGVLPRNIPNTVTGSPGFLVVLEHAFRLEPDVMFVVSDGNFQRGTGIQTRIPWEEVDFTLERLQKSRSTPAKIHFMGVAVKPETTQILRRILAKHHGTYSELSAHSTNPH